MGLQIDSLLWLKEIHQNATHGRAAALGLGGWTSFYSLQSAYMAFMMKKANTMFKMFPNGLRLCVQKN